MKKKISNDEIDLSDIILSLWDNKFKILVITTAFIAVGFLYFNSLDKSYSTSTNIKPISTFENQRYKLYNSFSEETSMKINSKSLFNLFINKIQTTEIIQDAIHNSNLVNQDKFVSKKIYDEEVKRIAILIVDQMSSPSENKKQNQTYWQYDFTVNNKLNWRNFLEYVEKKANEEIRQSLIIQFNTNLNILSNHNKFKLEDINQNIANELDDYKTIIANRLAFLGEQAEIARTLNIAKNTLESENFQTDNTIVTNIKSVNSYYLKGYEMIEKEINLINSRKNEKQFIENLFELEKNKRSILQDKKIERLKTLFKQTPVYNESEFVAAKIDYIVTVYEPNQSLVRILGISLIIGLLISFIYLFLINVIASRK
jgi:LPS O-antigen subunit length determinant protein (WzzB/FepE family)